MRDISFLLHANLISDQISNLLTRLVWNSAQIWRELYLIKFPLWISSPEITTLCELYHLKQLILNPDIY